MPLSHRMTFGFPLAMIYSADISHAGGKWWLVEPMAKASVVAGCDGLMIEVHNDPENALCDGPQSLKPDRYDNLLKDIRKLEAIR